MFGILPKGPCHARKRTKDTAVYSSEIEQLACIGSIDERYCLGCQFPEDLGQGPGVKQPRSPTEGPQRRRPKAQPTLNGLETRSLLKRAQARNRGTKEVEQQKTDVLVVEQLAVAGPITLGANVLQSR